MMSPECIAKTLPSEPCLLDDQGAALRGNLAKPCGSCEGESALAHFPENRIPVVAQEMAGEGTYLKRMLAELSIRLNPWRKAR